MQHFPLSVTSFFIIFRIKPIINERMYKVKKIILICVFFVVILFSASADTVFVYVEKGNMVLGTTRINEDAVRWITRFEDGIMDILFESGHIVFSHDSGRNQISDFRTLDRLAKSGGADILASVVLNLKVVDDGIEISGEYKLYNLSNDNIIHSSKHIFNDTFQRGPSAIEEKLFLAGQLVGRQIRPIL